MFDWLDRHPFLQVTVGMVIWPILVVGIFTLGGWYLLNAQTVPCALDPTKPCEIRRECKLCTRCKVNDTCCCQHVDKCTCDINQVSCCED